MMEWLDRTLMQNPVRYGLCTSEADFHKALRKMKAPPKDWPPFLSTSHANATVHHFDCVDGPAAIVCMPIDRKRNPVEIYGLLIHEAVHIWQEIRENIGEKEPSAEFEAYSVQWVAQQLIAAYIKAAKR